jgi:glyoxylase-like metal-dependent hydrolase (beta-lactamase superfamily II)
MSSKFFTTRIVAERTTLIRGTCGDNAYLLEGDTYALLIDTLTGAGNLAAFCRELTDLPIHVALTHGHADHSGGCFDFGVCSMHPDDIRFLYDDTTVEHRKFHIDRANGGTSFVKISDLTPPCGLRTYPVYDGDVFDLGGRKLEAIHVPGHSLGSIVFLERAKGIAFAGDACNQGTLLYLDGSTSVPDYKRGLFHFKKFQDAFDFMWWGHSDDPLPAKVIDEALVLCDRILAGKDDAEERGFYRAPFYFARSKDKDDGMIANIGYRKDWILAVPPYRMAPLPPEDK